MSARIDKIVSFVRPGHTVFDICCDHGLIGLGALPAARKVVFVDQSQKALRAVEDAVSDLSTDDQARIEIKALPGELLDISGYTDSDFIIAGVGITTIASIVASLFPAGLSNHRLILSPQQHSLPLRWYLCDRGFGLVDEFVVKERGRFREIIILEAEGPKVAEMFLPERDDISREYRAWLKTYRGSLGKGKEKTFGSYRAASSMRKS